MIKKRRRKAEINIIPLVDVLIVLIFFFLVSMQFRNISILNIIPPKIETAGTNKQMERLEVGISPKGEFYYNGTLMTRSELTSAINIAADIDLELPVLILADEDAYLKHVTFIMDTCRQAGLEKVRLQSRWILLSDQESNTISGLTSDS